MPPKDMLRLAFERGALTLTGASMGECGGVLRLQGRAQASHGFERGALTIKARVHYDSVIKLLRREVCIVWRQQRVGFCSTINIYHTDNSFTVRKILTVSASYGKKH